MGCIYRRNKKLEDGTLIETGPYWLKYYRHGRPICESAATEVYADAKAKLQQKEDDLARGLLVTNKSARILVSELLDDLKDEYRTNGRKTIDDLEGRCKNHVGPFFGRSRAASVTTANVRAFILARQKARASNAEINRELAALKRAYSIALKGGKLVHKPYIPMLNENSVRQGFFEREQFEAVRSNLPEFLQPVVTFAYLTTVTLRPASHPLDDGAATSSNNCDRKLTSSNDASQSKNFVKPGPRPAGLPGKLVHDFRRSAVRNMEKAGVPRSTAMKLTGHKTESVYRRYAIVSKKELQEGVAKLQVLNAMVTKTVTPKQNPNSLGKVQSS